MTEQHNLTEINEQAARVLNEKRVAVFIVAYNAARHIEKVLQRIPTWVAEQLTEIYLIDDSSSDETVATAQNINWPSHFAPLRIYRTPYNQGYGGNQRLGYLYAIEQQFDIVVLLHGDGQYAPEALPNILAAYDGPADKRPAAVFGSRFMTAGGAREGGMPLYKFIGNRILTWLQNSILGTSMSEMHSGYRSYSTDALRQVPFTRNALDFSFDADIIVQLHAAGLSVAEIPIPTFYGDEVCHVNGMKYAKQCLKTALKYRLMQFEIFYDPKFDLPSNPKPTNQQSPAVTSLQAHLKEICFPAEAKILNVTHDEQLDAPPSPNDAIIALDLLEHVANPDKVAEKLFNHLRSGGTLYTSTPNIAFLPLRLMLLAGWFNYSRRGILDVTHRRLFTVSAFCRLLRDTGFHLESVKGFGPPLAALPSGTSGWLRWLDRAWSKAARWWPTLFAYQILVKATRTAAADDLMKQIFPLSLAPLEDTRETEKSSATVGYR